MGIPRLTQDLQPYLEDVVFAVTGSLMGPTVGGLVMDGPSIVYHVYNCLLSYCCAEGVNAYSQCPQLLHATSCDAALLTRHRGLWWEDVSALLFENVRQTWGGHDIVFDGAFLISKQLVRREHLEKSRKALELYRAANPTLAGDFLSNLRL